MMRFLLCVMTAALLTSPAMAHVTANPNSGPAGQYFETKFRISHGCEGSDTVKVTVQMPKGTVVARPQFKPGWNIDIKKSNLAKLVPLGHGKMTNEQIDEIVWRGGSLSDEYYDEFGVILKLPDSAGDTLYFPVIQTCEEGENRWTDIPRHGQDWHDLKSPAPFVKIESAPGGHQH